MDPAIVKRLHDAFKLAYEDPKVIELYGQVRLHPRYMSTAAYAAFRAEVSPLRRRRRWKKLGLAKKDE
jgi:tripartite-type tricarboxylate transporter receptor subunit TctC